jgi:alpha-maltose-1-phosphate synthase|tara:strand:+ start:505 stop:2229 length:1725 start_codon:yes stop_codon:yes gene_type:complete
LKNNSIKSELSTTIAPWAVNYYHDAFLPTDGKLMGRHSAGSSYLRAIAQEQYSELGVLIRNKNDQDSFMNLFKSFLKNDQKIDLTLIPSNLPELSNNFGGIFLGDPQLGNYSILRSNFGHHLYSLVGITHTTMSKGIMDFISEILIKPVQEWDSLICTSNCVKNSVDSLLIDYQKVLSDRIDIKNITLPELPIIPLGVHTEDFDFSEEDKLKTRQSMGIGPDDIALIFVGRLSFHAKAHHFPMYKALQEVAENYSGKKKIHLIQLGWFANDYISNIMKDDAKLICPDVECHFVDGLHQKNKNLVLSSSDIFISLTDNFQETFGLTPLEAMAAGKPVVVTDWDGYKDTVRNNEDGFTIPTISLRKGSGIDLIYNYFSNTINYDQYISFASQRVAVDIDHCIDKLKNLIDNPLLRKKMGENGKKRANKNFSWTSVMKSYCELRDHLDEKRNSIKLGQESSNYIKIYDPMSLFESYPTEILNKNHILKCKTDKKLSEDHYLFTSKSIKIVQNQNKLDGDYLELNPNIKVVNSIIDILLEKKHSLSEIYSLMNISENTINKTIIIMLKFDIIALEKKD